MADESSAPSTADTEATAADFSDENIPVKGQDTSPGKSTPQDDDDDEDDEYAELVGEAVAEEAEEKPKEEKKEPEKKPDEKPSEKKEEKKPEPKKEEKEEEKPPETKDEKAKEEEEPPKPKLVRVKMGEEEYEVPEKVQENWEKLVTWGREQIQKRKELEENLITAFEEEPGKFSRYIAGLLTKKYGHDKAEELQTREYAGVVKNVIDRLNMPEPDRKALEASERAERAEAELKRYRDEQAEEAAKTQRTKEVNATFGEIRDAMTEAKLPLDGNRDLAIRSAKLLEGMRKAGQTVSGKQALQRAREEIQREQVESHKRYVESVKVLSDEEYAARFPDHIERARRLDLAKLKNGKTPAKTSTQQTAAPDERKSPRSKREVLHGDELAARNWR